MRIVTLLQNAQEAEELFDSSDFGSTAWRLCAYPCNITLEQVNGVCTPLKWGKDNAAPLIAYSILVHQKAQFGNPCYDLQ